MENSKKLEVVETKAILFTQGEGFDFETFVNPEIEVDGEKVSQSIFKEMFEEQNFEKSLSESNNGAPFLGTKTKNDTIIIGDQNVYALAFEDGSVYVVGKYFIPTNEKEYLDEVLAKIETNKI